MHGNEYGEPLWRRFSLEIGAIVLLGLLAVFVGIFLNSQHLIESAVEVRARAQFQTLTLMRTWNARHGGVFVEKGPGVVSNPYLAHPDIETRDGTVYTKKNPALMTREISELAAARGDTRYHITSLKPINPQNAADPFEREALLSFEKGATEATERVTENGRTLFRYMAPLRVEQPCLQCHANQGYKLGDIRGGISVSFDMTPIQRQIERNGLTTSLLFLMTVLLMLAIVFHRVGRLQGRLKRSNQRWQFALEGAGDGVWDWDLAAGKVHFSRRWKAMLGFAEDEVGDSVAEWEDRVHPDDIADCRVALDRHLRGETPLYETEHRIRRKDGRYAWILDRGKVVERTADGRPLRVIGTHTDITRGKTTEEALRESEARLRAVFDNTPVCLNLKDAEGRYLLVNRPDEEWLGQPAAEIIGRRAADFMERSHEAADIAAVERKVLETGQPVVRELRLTRQGRQFDRFVIKYPVKAGDGTVTGIGTVAIDNTERKQAEVALRESEERFATAFRSSPVAMAISRVEDGLLFDANDRWTALSGYSRDEAIGQTVAELGHWDDLDQRAVFIGQLRRDGRVRDFEAVFNPRSGGERTALISGEIIEIAGEERLLLAFNDITERKRADEAMRESERRFRSIVEGSIQGIAVNRDGRLLFVNQSYATIFGYDSPQELLAQPGLEVLFAPHERERLRDYRERRLRGDPAPGTYEYDGLRKDGTSIRLENRTTVVAWDGQPAVLSAVVDITEKEALARQLAHAQKMEVVGQLAGGTAHDFNNLLQVIQSNLELIDLQTKDDEALIPFLEAATHAVQRGATLSQQLLSFSRQQKLHPAVIDPNDLIERTVRLLRRLLGEDIRVATGLEDGVAAIQIDPNGLENAILNLAINARAAMPRGGTLALSTTNRRLAEDTPTEEGVLPAGDYVEIAVSDTGSGMPPEVLARVFEPFFTTKAAGEGSGLGLSMVYGFTLQSNGLVALESEVGQGTTVRMMFPAAMTEVAAAAEGTTRPAAGTGAGTVLVVEDDADVRHSVAMVLSMLGYAIREADQGDAALAVLAGDDGIDLLFTDVVIPGGMTGFDLAAEAVRRHPTLKVLLTSGYPEKALEKVGLAENRFFLLGKPYSTADLQAALQAALTG